MKKNSISFRLSIKYMGLVAFLTILLCSVFFGALFAYIKTLKANSLKDASSSIIHTIQNETIPDLDFLELPYFIVYTVYNSDTKEILSTNDTLLPLLRSIKPGKAYEYYETDFYADSNLKIAVLCQEIEHNGEKLIVECAMDIENDSLSKMASGFPKILLICLLPILAVSFYISYLISKKTVYAVQKLESAFEKEKSFTANVSHELKTPVAIIDGHANLIKRWGKENPQQLEESVNIILQETENMSSIIQTLLSLSKIENGQTLIQKKNFFVSNLFANLREEFTHINKNLKIQIEDEDFIEINSDEKILHQILTAIISNSIKYAGESCRIRLCCQKINGKIQVSVQDNGPGFVPETIPFVFERFYKGDKAHTRNGSGAGLGLAIAKALCHSINTEISASNATEGGALITITEK